MVRSVCRGGVRAIPQKCFPRFDYGHRLPHPSHTRNLPRTRGESLRSVHPQGNPLLKGTVAIVRPHSSFCRSSIYVGRDAVTIPDFAWLQKTLGNQPSYRSPIRVYSCSFVVISHLWESCNTRI